MQVHVQGASQSQSPPSGSGSSYEGFNSPGPGPAFQPHPHPHSSSHPYSPSNAYPSQPQSQVQARFQSSISPMAAPQQQVMSMNQARPITLPVEGIVPGISRLLYHAPADDRGARCMHMCRGFIVPWSCACLPSVSSALVRSRFVQVYENRIEVNEPDSHCVGCGTCVVQDRVSTIYFDRTLAQNATKATSCGPNCRHGDCCPDCFGMYGETLLLSADRAPCCSLSRLCCTVVDSSASTHFSNGACLGPVCDWGANPVGRCLFCCPEHKLVYGMENVEELTMRIGMAREMRMQHAPKPVVPF